MAMISRTIDIDAPVEQVYEYLTHPENLVEIWPSMVEVSNVQRRPDGAHAFDWVYKMAGIRFHGRAEANDVERNRRVVAKNARGIPSTFEYVYEAIGPRTRLTMSVDYTLPSQLLNRFAEPVLRKINENEATTLLHNLKARMELGPRRIEPTAPLG